MTHNSKYPPGAISSVEELRQAEQCKVWFAAKASKPVLHQLGKIGDKTFQIVSLQNQGQAVMRGQIVKFANDQTYFNCPIRWFYPNCEEGDGCLFRNFWYAYVYYVSQRQKAQCS